MANLYETLTLGDIQTQKFQIDKIFPLIVLLTGNL